MQFNFLFSFFAFVFIVIAGVFMYFLFRSRFKKKVLEDLEQALFLIKLSKKPPKEREGKDLKNEISLSERLFESLSSLKIPFVFEVAVPYHGQEISFFASLPEKYANVFVRQVQSLWTDASVERVEDFNIFNYRGVSLGLYAKLKNEFILSLKTYEDLNVDTFLPILGSLSKISEIGEGAAIQLVLKPADKSKRKRIMSALKVLKQGWTMREVLNNSIFKITPNDFIKALRGESKNDENAKRIDEEAVKMVSEKSNKNLFDVNIRVLVSAHTEEEANSLIKSITAGFEQFSAPNRNELVFVKPSNLKNLFYEFSYREFNPAESVILSSNELASIFHLPTSFTDVPGVKYLKSREAPPPPVLPKSGILIGYSKFRGERKEIYIADEDRRRHLYVIGQTGTGKSNFLTNMIVRDVLNGKGVCVVDPHGDLIEDVLSNVPKERAEDVIVFDPGNLQRPIGMNMLEYDFNKPEQKTYIINEMLQIFDTLYDLKETGGPMFEQYMRNALLLLMEDAPNEPATLMEVPRVFSDSDFRNRKLERVKNPVVQDFWVKEAEKAGGDAALENVTPYITSKFNNFTANDYMRPIVGQLKSAFNFRKIMDEGKIFLVNLSKGKIGDLNAYLLGMIFVGRILISALERVDIPEKERKDFYLYIDEFQNFTTDSISIILSEARKYRLNLIIAHQFIAQLKEKIRDSVFGNVGSMVAFRVGASDAEFLEKVFSPVFNINDLTNIDNFNAHVRLIINNETTVPFNIVVPRAPRGDYEFAKKIKELSFLKYGVPREKVESEIYMRLRV
jgi:hypothetical protein